MLIESDPYETRIAVLEEDRLTEVFLERRHHRGVVGNVYKGRVSRVLPGMQAAFVDIGLERDAFLYVADVVVGEGAEGFATGEDEERDEVATPGAEAAEASPAPPAPAAPSAPAEVSIDSLLRPGQELVVQVTKDPLPNKGARVTTQVTLPGRFVVYLPTVAHVGVSRRIESEEERERLRGIVETVRARGNGHERGGVIVRTAGEGRGAEELEADLTYLEEVWKGVAKHAEHAGAPTLVHQDVDLALRVIRDLLATEFSAIWVEGEESYARVVEYLDRVQPQLVSRVLLDDPAKNGDRGLFERFGIEREIEAALKPKVWLRSGGYLVINQTEALVAIDVNTGRFVGTHNLEETALAADLEAVAEVVRQIRLRDLGGIIVLDLIDMTEPEHRERVFQALESELRKDRQKNKVLSISEFGLVEITRKRSRANLERQLTQTCPYCEGSGRIKAVATICFSLRRSLLRMRGRMLSKELLVRAHPEVARALQGEEHGVLVEVERELGVAVIVQADAKLHHASYDILEL